MLQFYLAGVGVFSMPEDELFDLHTTNGRIVLPLLILLNIPAAAWRAAGPCGLRWGWSGCSRCRP